MTRATLAVLLLGCATEVPAADPPPPRLHGATPVTTVQDPAADSRPEPGDPVSLSGVLVTAVDEYDEDGSGAVGTIYVEEPSGGAYSGIAVFAPFVRGGGRLRIGDVVDVDGELAEFELGQINPKWHDDSGRTVTQLVSATVTWTGEWHPPDPQLVDVADFTNDREAESWEGVLVRVEDVVAGAPDARNAFGIAADLEVDDDLHRIEGVVDGTEFRAITGVVSYVYSYKLLPRSTADVEQ